MKILHISDIHADSVAPESRIDDYVAALKTKLNFITSLVSEHKPDLICFTGDAFHKKMPARVPYRLFGYMRDWFYNLAKLAKVFVIWGNHDSQSSDEETKKSQPFYHMFFVPECPSSITTFVGMDSCHNDAFEKGRISVVGVNHSYIFDSPEFDFVDFKNRVNGYCEGGSLRVLMLHQAVHPSNLKYPFYSRSIDQFKDFNVDLVLAGHIHEELGVVEFAPGKFFVNFGSVMRGSIHEYNLTRQPKVCMIEVDDNKKFSFTTYDLPAQPASVVFNLEALKESENRHAELMNFVNKLGSISIDSDGVSVDTSVISSKERILYESMLSSVGAKTEDRRSFVASAMGYNPFA